MNKAEALQQFWSSFGLKAYDESTVPTGENAPEPPYITYNVQTDSIGGILLLTGSIWYRTSSWKEIEKKTEEVAKYIGYGSCVKEIEGGYMRVQKGNPFAQRMADPSDDMIRRMYINITVEFLTAY